MGRIGRLISFVRAQVGGTKASDVKVDRGGGDNRTPQHFSAPGDDSFPLPGDFVAIIGQAGTGRDSAVGYVDPKNLQKAASGDKRIYARSANGDEIVQLWLKNDGTAELSNSAGSMTLQPDGTQILQNANGSFTLNADGSHVGVNDAGKYELLTSGNFVVNTAIIDPAGNLTATSYSLTSGAASMSAAGEITAPSAVIDGKELANHTHPAGTPPGDTGTNN